jgi:rod shape-determining protein MreC
VFRKNSKLLIYALVFVATFLLIFSRSGFLNSLKFTVVQSVSLPLRIVLFPFQELKKVLFYHRTFEEYMRLRTEVDTMKNRLTGLNEVLEENNRLARLLDFKRKLIFSSVAASVVGRDPSNWDASLLIDKGANDAIEIGAPVVNAMGVVGKVAQVSTDKAKVILVTDPTFSVVALVQRSREIGLVSGTLQGLCRMRYLSQGADIEVGDQIVTSKLSSSFPEGLLIGEVTEVHSDDKGVTTDCLIKPAVPLSQIEEVLVIRKQ